MARKWDNRSMRLHLMVLLCAVLFVLVLHVKMPVQSHARVLGDPVGRSETWSSGQKLELVPILVIAPIFLTVFLHVVSIRHAQCWNDCPDDVAIPKSQFLLNLELYLRPPPAR
jgi:hypothetical protein